MTSGVSEEATGFAICDVVRRCLAADVLRSEPLEPGLGSRRFYRLHLSRTDPQRVIARVEMGEDAGQRPPESAPEPELEPLRGFLEAAGLPVPRSYGRAPETGIELLEDLGPRNLGTALSEVSETERGELYSEACALVPRMQALDASPREIPAFGRGLTRELFRYKADQLISWGIPAAAGRPTRAAEAQTIRAAFDVIADVSLDAPQRFSHRDFKAANLHLREGAVRGSRLAMIDLQGAFLAPPEYDLVCLLRDAQVSLSETEIARHLERVRPALPDSPDADTFLKRFDLLTISRLGKDLSRFLYVAQRRNDRRCLRFVPRAAHHLRRATLRCSEEPGMDRLAELLSSLPEPSCEP